jgi:hypothetical protein
MAESDDNLSRTVAGLRFDLIIAVCALLISTLAAGASWWQARVVQAQTQVLQAQLGAQVWPYVSIDEGITDNTVQIEIVNDGLGPAVLRSVSATVDGVPKSNVIDIMHAILGSNLTARGRKGKFNLAISGSAPGSVLRPGESITLLGFTSKQYAQPFITAAYRRLRSRICYCAIIPGKCWLSDSGSTRDPQPVDGCPEIATDLLHASAVNELFNSKL